MIFVLLVFFLFNGYFYCDIGVIVINVVNGQGFVVVDGGGECYCLVGLWCQYYGFVVQGFIVVVGNMVDGNVEWCWVVDGEIIVVGGQGQFFGCCIVVVQFGRMINKFKV